MLVVGAVLVLIGRCGRCLAFRLVMNSCLIWRRRESCLVGVLRRPVTLLNVSLQSSDTVTAQTNLADRVTGRRCCDGRVFRVLVCASVAMNLFNILSPSCHYMYRKAVTICTAQWSLYVPHSGHYMYRTAVTICTAQRSLYVPHSGHYMYRTAVIVCTAQ